MEEQIQELINRYKNSMDSWKHSVHQWKCALERTPKEDTKQINYWKQELRVAQAKIDVYVSILNSLTSLIKSP